MENWSDSVTNIAIFNIACLIMMYYPNDTVKQWLNFQILIRIALQQVHSFGCSFNLPCIGADYVLFFFCFVFFYIGGSEANDGNTPPLT